MRGLHTKHKKNLPFHRRTITRRYFTESCKKITGFCHIHRRLSDGFSDANTDGLSARMSDTCPFARLPTALSTNHACLTRVRLHAYRPMSHTDGITDGSRMFATCPSARVPMEFPTEWPTERKVWRDFRTFLVRISINFRRNYRRKLIAPTAINFRR